MEIFFPISRLLSYGDFLSYFQTGKLWRFSFLFPTTGIENLFRSMVSHERNKFNKINADRPAPVTIYHKFTAGNILLIFTCRSYSNFLFIYLLSPDVCNYHLHIYIYFFIYL